MNPSPDTKGAQPEQLVETAKGLSRQLLGENRNVPSDATALVMIDAAHSLDALATALSECRGREQVLRDELGDALLWIDKAGMASRFNDWLAGLRVSRDALAAQPPSEETP